MEKSKALKSKPDGDGEYLKTRDILNATGITHQILYRYITLGLIAEEKTTETGQRLFSPYTVDAILLIQRLNQTGYTLRDIKDIFFKEKRLRNKRESSRHRKPK